MADDDASRKNAEREAKKAEVRKRLEEQGKAGKKAKKGFLTPDRKKKLRKLLMMKAAEDLKQQQLKKEQERQKFLAERVTKLPDLDTIDDAGKLQSIYQELWTRVCQLEDEKYDINFQVKEADYTINQLTIEVNDLKGKYVKPTLKKVSKYDNKFKKMAQKEGGAEKLDFRNNLKVVRNSENILDEIMNKKKKDDKPDWSKKGEGEEKAEAAPAAKEEKAPVAEAPPAVEEEEAPAEEPQEEEEGEYEEGDEEEEEE